MLVARRTRPEELRGLWEFPGGKLEPGETPQECLVRELEEELGYSVTVGAALGASVRDEPGRALLRLTAYSARPTDPAYEPVPIDGTHDAIRWVTADELDALALAPLDVPLVEGVRKYLSTLS